MLACFTFKEQASNPFQNCAELDVSLPRAVPVTFSLKVGVWHRGQRTQDTMVGQVSSNLFVPWFSARNLAIGSFKV